MSEEKEVDLLGFARRSLTYSDLDRFYLAVTPKLYEWLRWVLTLAALSYVQKKSDSFALRLLFGLTLGLTCAYLNSFFYQFRFTGIPYVKSPTVARSLSILLAGSLGFATWLMVTAAVEALVAAQH